STQELSCLIVLMRCLQPYQSWVTSPFRTIAPSGMRLLRRLAEVAAWISVSPKVSRRLQEGFLALTRPRPYDNWLVMHLRSPWLKNTSRPPLRNTATIRRLSPCSCTSTSSPYSCSMVESMALHCLLDKSQGKKSGCIDGECDQKI